MGRGRGKEGDMQVHIWLRWDFRRRRKCEKTVRERNLDSGRVVWSSDDNVVVVLVLSGRSLERPVVLLFSYGGNLWYRRSR